MITWMKTIEKLILAGNLGKSIVKDTDGKDEFYWHESTVKLASGDIIPAWVLKDHSDPSGESFGTIFRFGNDWIPQPLLTQESIRTTIRTAGYDPDKIFPYTYEV